jgi:methylated-DNA-protein-cysteine methyltransferase related protein
MQAKVAKIEKLHYTVWALMHYMKFCEKVEHITKKIPKGKVASYGQIAALVSTVRAAQAVGWCLHGLDGKTDIPWHRVINSKGYITTSCEEHDKDLQKNLLEKEGVKVTKKDELWWIDMKKFLWIPK